MTYKTLFDLKFRKGFSTYDLLKKFPGELQQVSEVAMLDIPEAILREIVDEEEELRKLIRLKKQLTRYLGNSTS